MKLSEFDKIRPFLKNDVEVEIVGMDNSPPKTLIKQTWGNHDGRYNMLCTVCGWTSRDIFPGRNDEEPKFCPRCAGKGKGV